MGIEQSFLSFSRVLPIDKKILKIRSYIANMQAKSRVKDCKIIYSIMQNIYIYPYDGKYRNINIKRLKLKLSNHRICFKILPQIGFKASNDNTRLIIDESEQQSLPRFESTFSSDMIRAYQLLPDNKLLISKFTQMQHFKRMDCLIGTYYASKKIDNYFNTHGVGKFLQYIIDNELNDLDIPIDVQFNDEFMTLDRKLMNNMFEEGFACRLHMVNLYTDFDLQHFPWTDSVLDLKLINSMKRAMVYHILKNCYVNDE
eukprot:98957_1